MPHQILNVADRYRSMPANGSSSSMNAGLPASARAISQRRRSPPDSEMDGALRSRAMSNSSSSRSSWRSRAALSRSTTSSTRECVLDIQAAENGRLLRQIADAEPRALVHRQRRDVLPVERDDALVGLHQSGDHVEHGGLAGAVGAEQPDRLALPHHQRDVLHDGARAVSLAEVVDGERPSAEGAAQCRSFGSQAEVGQGRPPRLLPPMGEGRGGAMRAGGASFLLRAARRVRTAGRNTPFTRDEPPERGA